MSDEVIIYHNPKCSKSRQTLALLEAQGISLKVIKYLETPPTKTKVLELIAKLEASGGQAHDLLRTKEAPYKELGLSKESSKKAIAEAISAHPILLERPLVLKGERAALGRPPENALSVL